MRRVEQVFTEANRWLVSAVLAIVFAIVTMNVVGRYGFGSSFAWVEETARHLMILGAFSGAGLALREGRLVAIGIVPELLSEKFRRLLRWAIVFVMFAFMATMAWLGVKFVQFGWPKETMSTGISRGIPYLSIPVGCVIFLIHLLLYARRFVYEDFDYTDMNDGSERGADVG
ncbi:MAG: TRAP transporter small permease [Rhizobiaceae bacterium]|nr:TRAP transporter small permease [Rhizobiaceae bacterium]